MPHARRIAKWEIQSTPFEAAEFRDYSQEATQEPI
jgi:hypothetical protein